MKNNNLLLITNSIDVSTVPEIITILPLGHINSKKGKFLVDEESFKLMYAEFKSRKIDIVIDYEHQTLHDQQAPAGGWIKELSLGKDGILATVEWTSRAKEYLINKEYRYLSPVIMTRQKDGKAVSLHSVALTNSPAINGMKPIINSMKGSDGLEAQINTEADAGERTESETANNDLEAFTGELKEILSLSKTASYQEILTSIKAIMVEGNKASKELSSLKYELYEQEVDDLIMTACKQGKISSAMRENAKNMAMKDIVAFKDFIQSSPVVVPIGKMQLTDAPNVDKYHSSQASRLLRISEEDYKKYSQ